MVMGSRECGSPVGTTHSTRRLVAGLGQLVRLDHLGIRHVLRRAVKVEAHTLGLERTDDLLR
jgi:hypothetical protein